MATCRDAKIRSGREAIELAAWGVQLCEGREPLALGTLAAAYAEAGRFADALKCADRAIAAADARVEANLAKSLRGQREQYRQGKPYRE